MQEILDAIDKQIKYHEAELAGLRAARDVVSRLQGVPSQQVERVATNKAKSVVTHVKRSVTARQPSKRVRTSRLQMRTRILETMQDGNWHTTGAVAEAIGASTVDDKAAMYRLFAKLSKASMLVRDKRLYKMVPESA